MAEEGTSLVGLNDELFDNICTVCEERKLNVEAKVYCRPCDKYFCKICCDIHGDSLSDHVVLDASERMPEIQTRRIILVGKSGHGKSATGNSILGEKSFEAEDGFNAITQFCKKSTKFQSFVRRNYTVVDTPGLFDTNKPFAETALEIQRAVDICPEPHAFLIILRQGERYTEEDKLTIDILRVIYGEAFLNHAVLVFTRGSDFKSDQSLKDAIAKNEMLNTLKNECGGRVTRIENNPDVDSVTRGKLVGNVFNKIEEVSDDGEKLYSFKYLYTHRNILKKHLEERKSNVTLGDEITELVKEIDHQLTNEKWRGYLVGIVGCIVYMYTCMHHMKKP